MLSIKFKVLCLLISLIFTLFYFQAVFNLKLSLIKFKHGQHFVQHILKISEIQKFVQILVFNLKQLLIF